MMNSRGFSSTLCALISALLLAGFPNTSYAADAAIREAARDLGYEGVEAFQSGDYQTATERLERAFQVLQLPSLALWSARALEKNGKLLEASERYLEATRLSTEGAGEEQVQLDAQAAAEEERDALRERIPKVFIEVRGAPAEEVQVTIGESAVPAALYDAGRPSNPGEMEVVGTWDGRTVSETVTLEEGDRKTVTLTFTAVAAPGTATAEPGAFDQPEKQTSSAPEVGAASPKDGGPQKSGSSWQKPVGWIGIGVGVAGMAFGGVTGFIAMQRNQDLDENCPDRVCGPDQETERWQYNNLRVMSSAGLIGGGVLAAAGVTLLLTAPKKTASSYVSPYVGFSSAGVSGAF